MSETVTSILWGVSILALCACFVMAQIQIMDVRWIVNKLWDRADKLEKELTRRSSESDGTDIFGEPNGKGCSEQSLQALRFQSRQEGRTCEEDGSFRAG